MVIYLSKRTLWFTKVSLWIILACFGTKPTHIQKSRPTRAMNKMKRIEYLSIPGPPPGLLHRAPIRLGRSDETLDPWPLLHRTSSALLVLLPGAWFLILLKVTLKGLLLERLGGSTPDFHQRVDITLFPFSGASYMWFHVITAVVWVKTKDDFVGTVRLIYTPRERTCSARSVQNMVTLGRR